MRMKEKQEKKVINNTPPASMEAEQATLGSILIRPQTMDEVADILSPKDFYREAHRQIYRVMLELHLRNEPVDITTVNLLLKERGQLEEVGGPVFLMGLSDNVGIAANVGYYAQKVREKARLRRLLATTQEIAGACLAPVEDVAAFLDWAEEQVFQAKDDQDTQEAFLLEDLIPDEQARIETCYYQKREILGIPSGFLDLDRLTGGWQNGDLVILAARPSHGKTAMALNLAFHAGKVAGVPAVIFSMEQPKEQLVQRFFASVGEINATHLRSGKMAPLEFQKLEEGIEALAEVPIYIIDKPALTPLQIRSHTRRLKSRQGIGLVIIDYLQLARFPKAKSQEQEVNEISRSLKALAKEMGLPVIALSQLNRKVEERPNKRPQLADLRGSGSIEQDADLVLFLYRDQVYRPDTVDRGVAEVHLAKQRNGPTGKVKLAFFEEYMLFRNLASDQPAFAGL